ncbi:hypothetical protein QAD02_017834 [Eretmocerus hayati]|uniref:Uncharacterized protein n=1 Tax=Eretmocerus hayati TaxID=131215 RepID=A0ACC2PFC5_9HYME|nr:hypothetical protein QAD02_017834 [Eretmocerus hayati]
MRILELYAGIGGMHYAFQESMADGTVVSSIDINTVSNEVYQHNFPMTPNICKSIESSTIQDIMKLEVDCILMSPPCQPFTRQGLKQGSADNRCASLLHVLKLIPYIKTLKYVLLENVKGFESFEVRNDTIVCLENSDFNYKEFILSPHQFGIPNSRHRYYLIAKKKGLNFIFSDSSLATSIPEDVRKLLPQKMNKFSSAINSAALPTFDSMNCFPIKHYLEDNVDSKYLIPISFLIKRGNLLDIRTPDSTGSCCFTKAYRHYAEGTGSVLARFDDPKLKEKIQDLKKNPDEEKERNLQNLNLRYFTPKEISRLMCFPEHFEFPSTTTDMQKYRLLGNSINVHVVSILIHLLSLNSFK